MKEKWDQDFFWILDSNTWIKTNNKLILDDDDKTVYTIFSGQSYITYPNTSSSNYVFDINENYFKYQKCLSGITYQFVNQLDNIYEKNLMVGTNYCIYCMYSEFDIINNFMVNLYEVDICSTINLDLTQKYYEIDGAYLRSGHRVLLVNQGDAIENDIYIVDSRGFLILSDDLSDVDRTWRYKAYVKLGNNKGKQFHLKNTGNRFPLKGEKKYFLEGHGYIIKNSFNYDLKDKSSKVPKLIFTDYELCRISLNQNYDLYKGFTLPNLITGDTVTIQFLNNNYTIEINDDTTKFQYTDTLTFNTIYNTTGSTFDYSNTYIYTDTTFCNNASVNDYIELEISGRTNLYLKSLIKHVDSDFIILYDYINDNILNDFYTGTTSTYIIKNLMYSEANNINNILLKSYFSKYFTIDNNNYLYPIEYQYNKYVDYDVFNFIISGGTLSNYKFTTNNYYINYRLYEHLNKINSYLFNSGYSFLINYYMQNSEFKFQFYDERHIPNTTVYPDTLGDTKGTLIKVTPYIPSVVNYFKKYTYVNLCTNYGKFKTLIVDLVPNEYFIIETYKSNSGLTNDLIAIETIYNLKEISDILYDVYLNGLTDINQFYYRIRSGNMKKNICNGYASFISEDMGIISNTTAILMQDDQNKFLLKIYDPENIYNGGYTRVPNVVTKLNPTLTATSAVLPGEIINDGGSNIKEKGMYYSNMEYDMSNKQTGFTYTNSSNIGPFTVALSKLTPNTTYYYQSYAENEQGVGYGDIYSFTTLNPSITGATVVVLDIQPSSHSIKVKSEVIDTGYLDITSRGIVYQTGNTYPTTDDYAIIYPTESNDVGIYDIDITGLTHNTLYSINAFVVNDCGTTYGYGGSISTLYPTPPIVQTKGYLNLSYDSFDALFELVSNNGSTQGPFDDPVHGVDELGIVWSTGTTLPTINDNVLPYSTPGPYNVGDFSVSLIGLNYEQYYNYRSYAINSLYSGNTTSYGNNFEITTLPLPIAPTIRITDIDYASTTANVSTLIVNDGGSPILYKGLYYDSGSTVDTGNTFIYTSGSTSWITNITGLTPLTEYTVMSMASNAFNTGYSESLTFITQKSILIPTVDISLVIALSTGATLYGNIIDIGASDITSKGILFSGGTFTSWQNISAGSGNSNWFSVLTGLTVDTLYYAKSYAINIYGTGYSDVITFTTQSGVLLPAFDPNSPIIESIGLTNSVISNEIKSDGNSSIISRGIYYSGSTTPTWIDLPGGSGSGQWITNITGLTQGTTYFIYGYATNSTGTTNTPIKSFDTLYQTIPTVVINSTSNITYSGITINAEITSDGYSTIIERGITGSTIGLWKHNLVGTGQYSINLTGLTQNTTYEIYAYAINSIGTAYSSAYTFTTSVFNNVTILMNLSSVSNINPYIYQVGTTTSDIISTVNITSGNIPKDQLWSGLTYFTAYPLYGSPSTGLTWGLGVTSASNTRTPYTYSPITVDTQYITAIQSCGIPEEIKTYTVNIYSVYPILTSNRQGTILSDSVLRSYALNGYFYQGNFAPNYEYMEKKVETYYNYKVYSYNIGITNNLVYFAYPMDYGQLTRLIIDGVEKPLVGVGAPKLYTNVQMASRGLVNDWITSYYVYAFFTTIKLGNIYIEYYF